MTFWNLLLCTSLSMILKFLMEYKNWLSMLPL